jgi:cyclic beta-1,2-glucan synthetase
LRCVLTLAPTEEHEVVFLLGQGTDAAEAHALAARYRDPAAAEQAQQASQARWRELLGAVQVQTPDPALDVLLNGWLLYQTLVCRIWGRSAFYQSGGAYGFRDQLQDVMALAATAPELAREQIVRAAARQFVAGDVQHWWHPPSGRGIRTNFSDDYLWLPYVVHHYSRVTGDSDILNVTLPFLNGRALATGEAEYYDLPTPTSEVGSLYEHCTRAIEYGLGRMGPHGLPLMGAGDWNDGMNLVGEGGTGESVWVGWFMISVLRSFAELAAARNDQARVERYLHEAERLNAALETHAWDGDWYLRAFYDDGTALGSQHSAECRIDSLTQSWAVISGAGATARAQQGMEEVQAQLVDHAAGLIRLFTPPFDTSEHNPGYIKGYVPGVRENGGQYTHAAIWAIWAWALLGKSERVHELVQLINPVRHSMEHPERYLVEPYVIAADVYTATGHVGRGGWTWYTGSAGWFYRLGLEQLLGLQRNGSNLRIKACLPASWPGYTATYRYGTTMYHIHVERSTASSAIWLDGTLIAGDLLPLNDDGAEHRVEIAVRG